MWIRRQLYDMLHAELIEHRARAVDHIAQAATVRTQVAFLTAQINQLQKERAIYLRQITKLDIPVPELAIAPPSTSPDQVIRAALDSNLFEDMGDEAARRQRVQWDDDGRVTYGDTAEPPAAGE